MKIGSRSESEQRQWKHIIERPFTLLAGLSVFLILAGGFFLSLRYAETERLLYRSLSITALISVPAIAVLATLWRRERRTPYAMRIRRIAWKIMLGLYCVMLLGALLLVLLVEGAAGKKVAVLAAVVAFAPTGIPLYRLLKDEGKAANHPSQPTPLKRRG